MRCESRTIGAREGERQRRRQRAKRERKRISFARDAVLAPTALSTRTSAKHCASEGEGRGAQSGAGEGRKGGPFSILTIMKRLGLLPLANERTNSSEAASGAA